MGDMPIEPSGGVMFTLLTPFIVLIERRRLARRLLAAMTALAVAATGLAPTLAHARKPGGLVGGFDRVHKVARDLGDELEETAMPKRSWSRHVGGQKMVQAVIVSDSDDPEMGTLRSHVEKSGGRVLAVHGLVRAMTVEMPARQIRVLAKRSEVVSISPNRETQRSASTLESITGALTSKVRGSSTKTSYSGLDGSGVGIAILDSGVMREHWAFADAYAGYRVKCHVNMLNTSLANWTGSSASYSLTPGSAALSSYEAAIDNQWSDMQ